VIFFFFFYNFYW